MGKVWWMIGRWQGLGMEVRCLLRTELLRMKLWSRGESEATIVLSLLFSGGKREAEWATLWKCYSCSRRNIRNVKRDIISTRALEPRANPVTTTLADPSLNTTSCDR
jgi:hypothetical protein